MLPSQVTKIVEDGITPIGFCECMNVKDSCQVETPSRLFELIIIRL